MAAIPANPLPVPNVVNFKSSLVTTATTDRTGGSPSNLVAAYLPGANGDVITCIRFIATGATAAGSMLIFLEKSGTYTLYYEIVITAITPDATGTIAWAKTWFPDCQNGLIIPSGVTVYCGCTQTQNVCVSVQGASY